MSDVFSRKKRSEVMSKIRGHGNKDTEVRLAVLFRKAGITGWRRQYRIEGRPDFAFPNKRLAVFVDGCFWHGCPRCYQAPKDNAKFWRDKIRQNKARDRFVTRRLRREGWGVFRIWGCRLMTGPEVLLCRIRSILDAT